MSNGQLWFLKMQRQIEERVGEPVLLSIKMPFDTWFEVEINTFTDRRGVATGREVETAIDEAVEMLLEMDQVIAEVTGRQVPYYGETE